MEHSLMAEEKEIKKKKVALEASITFTHIHQPSQSHMTKADGYPGRGPANNLVGQ